MLYPDDPTVHHDSVHSLCDCDECQRVAQNEAEDAKQEPEPAGIVLTPLEVVLLADATGVEAPDTDEEAALRRAHEVQEQAINAKAAREPAQRSALGQHLADTAAAMGRALAEQGRRKP